MFWRKNTEDRPTATVQPITLAEVNAALERVRYRTLFTGGNLSIHGTPTEPDSPDHCLMVYAGPRPHIFTSAAYAVPHEQCEAYISCAFALSAHAIVYGGLDVNIVGNDPLGERVGRYLEVVGRS